MNSTLPPSCFKNIPIVAVGTAASAANTPFHHWRPAAVTHRLMPYEAAAKSIFVKANGLPAYVTATGLRSVK